MSAVAAETALRSVLVIEGAEELAAIENEVRAFAAPLGYDRFVLFSASAAQDAVLQSIYWLEGDWFGDGESVDAETYIRRCPVTRHILESHEPFFWTKTVKDRRRPYPCASNRSRSLLRSVRVGLLARRGRRGTEASSSPLNISRESIGQEHLPEDRQPAQKFAIGWDQRSCVVPTHQGWSGDTPGQRAIARTHWRRSSR